jgi:hypothetical protein
LELFPIPKVFAMFNSLPERSDEELLNSFVGLDGASRQDRIQVLTAMTQLEVFRFINAYTKAFPRVGLATLSFLLERIPAEKRVVWDAALAKPNDPNRSESELLAGFVCRSKNNTDFSRYMKEMNSAEIPRFTEAYAAAFPRVAAESLAQLIKNYDAMAPGTERVWNAALETVRNTSAA